MSATLRFLGLSAADLAVPEPEQWTPDALAVALRRLRALGGAQIRLFGGDPLRGGGKNVILCGRERSIGGGELMVEHVEWQVGHLYLLDGGPLFDRVLSDLLAVDVAALPAAGGERERGAVTADDWPACQDLELVSAGGAAVRVRVADVRRDEPLARAVRSMMAAVDQALVGAEPFRSRGPWHRPEVGDCLAEAVRRALLASLRPPEDWFTVALRDAAAGDRSALARLSRPWPATNSGIEVALGNAGLFLLGAQPHPDPFSWHRQPGQPGAQLRRLVALATARRW